MKFNIYERPGIIVEKKMKIFQYLKSSFVAMSVRLLDYRWVKALLLKAQAKNKFLADYYCRVVLAYALLQFQEGHIARGTKALDHLDLSTVPRIKLPIVAMFYDVCGKPNRRNICLALLEHAESNIPGRADLQKLGCKLFGSTFAPIGHSALIEIYVKAKILKLIDTTKLVICLEKHQFSNYALIEYWNQQYCELITDRETVGQLRALLAPCEEKLGCVQMADGRMLPFEHFALEVQSKWEAANAGALLGLSIDHRERGYLYFQSLGMPKDAWFCGLHVRDTEDTLSDIRNANIETYDLAIFEIEKRGGWVIRIGDRKMPPLKANKYKNVIDYAHRPDRQDWLDIFIAAACRFFIGTGSGPSAIPISFGVPVLYTNWGPLLNRQWGNQDLLVPKQYWSARHQRYLNMYERMEPSIGRIQSKAALLCEEIEVHDNNPEILKAAVIEMMDGVNRSVSECSAQIEFRELCILNKVYPTRVASAFIDQYPHFFE